LRNPEEKQAADGKHRKTDLYGGTPRVAIKHGRAPIGNQWASPVSIHREPLYTDGYAPVEKYPTYADRKDFYRVLPGRPRTHLNWRTVAGERP